MMRPDRPAPARLGRCRSAPANARRQGLECAPDAVVRALGLRWRARKERERERGKHSGHAREVNSVNKSRAGAATHVLAAGCFGFPRRRGSIAALRDLRCSLGNRTDFKAPRPTRVAPTGNAKLEYDDEHE